MTDLPVNETNPDADSSAGKQVIARAAAVLRALENQSAGLSLSQISKASGLPRTTVHRIVAALEAQQMVMSGDKGIRLGPAIVRLAASAHTDVIAVARPFVEALGRRTRETVDVCVFRGQFAVSVDQYASDHELRVVSAVGTGFPVHCTAHGKMLLAARSNDDVRAVLGAQLPKRTPNTLDTLDALIAQLDYARTCGFAVDDQEHALGVCGIGVFVRTGLADDYAIALAVPALRFKDQFDALQAALMQCKSEIESVFGTAR
ncbi:IclR family transcriptional regulator [Paraburkholderia sp.]|uniref:IclR family transcriptional regulator n=1 Tax=Paraburkholderia sp. TaxID=1926495 RepID=UPI002392552B|nr:IclR family transcriptional regulator [Paraburkholderia sp.]MDE1180517.1 IclR family transcriptional regulator [Paraburkholderia sp.]